LSAAATPSLLDMIYNGGIVRDEMEQAYADRANPTQTEIDNMTYLGGKGEDKSCALPSTDTPTSTPTNTPTSTVTNTPTPPVFQSFGHLADSTTTLGNPTPTPGGYHYSGYTDSGQPWQTDGSTWGISGGQAYLVAPPGGSNYVRVVDRTPPVIPLDQTVTLTVASRSFSGQVGLISRVTPDWNSYLLWVGTDASGNVEVWTLINGDWGAGAIATGTATLPASGPFTLEARTSGTALTVRVNGAVVANAAVPAAPANATEAGIYVDSSGPTPWARLVDFTVE
jgi:hypothetical protein